jgi:hypothetical protein
MVKHYPLRHSPALFVSVTILHATPLHIQIVRHTNYNCNGVKHSICTRLYLATLFQHQNNQTQKNLRDYCLAGPIPFWISENPESFQSLLITQQQ